MGTRAAQRLLRRDLVHTPQQWVRFFWVAAAGLEDPQRSIQPAQGGRPGFAAVCLRGCMDGRRPPNKGGMTLQSIDFGAAYVRQETSGSSEGGRAPTSVCPSWSFAIISAWL